MLIYRDTLLSLKRLFRPDLALIKCSKSTSLSLSWYYWSAATIRGSDQREDRSCWRLKLVDSRAHVWIQNAKPNVSNFLLLGAPTGDTVVPGWKSSWRLITINHRGDNVAQWRFWPTCKLIWMTALINNQICMWIEKRKITARLLWP